MDKNVLYYRFLHKFSFCVWESLIEKGDLISSGTIQCFLRGGLNRERGLNKFLERGLNMYYFVVFVQDMYSGK